MADPVNDGNSNPASKPKEMSMEVRLLLAFLLMGAVMFVTPYLFKTETPPGAKKPSATTSATQNPPESPVQNAAAPAQPAAAPTEETAEASAAVPTVKATPQQPLPPFVIDSDRFRITLSNQGATVRSWQLKNFRGNDEKPLELTNTAAGLEYPFSLHFPGKKPTTNPNWAYFTQTADPDGLGVTYEFSDGHTVVRKRFRFEKSAYLAAVSAEVTVDGKPIPSMIEWRGGFGDLTVANPGAKRDYLLFRRYSEQVSGAIGQLSEKGSGDGQWQLLVRGHLRRLLLRRAPAARTAPRSRSPHLAIRSAPRWKKKPRPPPAWRSPMAMPISLNSTSGPKTWTR